LQGLPSVGRQRALKLLDHFGIIEAVINADVGNLKAAEFIGEKVAEKNKMGSL